MVGRRKIPLVQLLGARLGRRCHHRPRRDLDDLGAMGCSICCIRGRDCHPREDRRHRNRLEPRDCYPHVRRPHLHVAPGLAEQRATNLSAISSRSWTFLILSGIATGLSWLCYFRALQLGPASKVAPIDKLSLVFVIAAAAIFLGEPVSNATAVGAALVLAGVLVLALA